MGMFDFLINPAWRRIKKLPGDRKCEASRVVAVYGQAVATVELMLIKPRHALFDGLIQKGFCPDAENRQGASPCEGDLGGLARWICPSEGAKASKLP